MKIQSSASLNNSERDGLSEVLGYITKVYGDDVDFEKYDVVRNALSGDELKRLEDMLIYTIDDREYCKTVNKRILKDDLPLLNKVYEILDDNDLFKNNRGDYDWDAMEAFEKLCLKSSKGSSGIIKSNDSVNDYVNAQRTIVNIIKKYNRENRDYEYTQRVKNNGGDVSGMFPMNVKPDDFTKNGDYLDAVSVIENFTGKPFDLEEFKRKNASSINSSKVKTIKSDIDWEAVKHGFDDKRYLIYKTGIDGEWEEFPFYGTDDFSVAHVYKGKGYKVEKNENINSSRRNAKEKIMNRRNMKKMVKSGYSNNPDYFGDWFGKGQIDFDAIINPEDDGDLWMVKLWSGSGYALDVYLCKANNIYEAIDIVFEWSYENEGHNEMIFDYNYVYDEACDAYDEYVDHPDWFSYGDNLSKEDFVDRYVEDNYVGDDNELYACSENFFVDKVPDKVLAENRGSVQNSRKSKKGKSVKSNRKLIKSYGGFDEQNDCLVDLEISIDYDRLFEEFDESEVNRVTDDFEEFVENWFSNKIRHNPIEEFHDDFNYNVTYWVPKDEIKNDMDLFSWDEERNDDGNSWYYMNLNGSDLSFSGFGNNYENEELVDEVFVGASINVIVYDMELIKSSRKPIKSSVDEKNPWFEKLSDSEKEAVLFDMKINPDLIGEYRDELSENGADYDDYKWAKPTEEWLLKKINRKNWDGKFSYFDETDDRQKRHYAEVFDEDQYVKSSRRPIKSTKTSLPMYNVYLIAWQEPDTLIEQLKQVKDKLSIKTIAKYPNNEILVQIDPTADVLGIKKELENMADVVLADYAHVTIKPEYVVSSLIRSARDDRVEDYISKRGINSSRKSIKSSVDSSTIADILKARKEVKEVEDRGDEVIAYLHKDYRDVDADRLADEVLGTIETKYDDFTWDYSSAWMDYNDDEYDDTYVVIIEKKEIESACHGKKKNKKKGKSVKSNRKQIKSGRFIKSGAGAAYDVTIRGIELDDSNYKIISDEITDERYNEHTTVVEVPVKPCIADEWIAESYYNGIDSNHEFFSSDDRRIEGGKAKLELLWYESEEGRFIADTEYSDVNEAAQYCIPNSIDIKATYGWGWIHANLSNESIHFDDKNGKYGLDEENDGNSYSTVEIDLICPNISQCINAFFENPEDYYPEEDYIESSRKPIKSSKDDKQKAKELWAEFENIPINDNDEIEKDFLHFEAGTDRFEIWKWFEQKFGVSIGDDLMYDEQEEIESSITRNHKNLDKIFK